MSLKHLSNLQISFQYPLVLEEHLYPRSYFSKPIVQAFDAKETMSYKKDDNFN